MAKKKYTKAVDLTVVMLARNAEETIEPALVSVDFAKEIIVIDDESIDSTVDIALKHSARILTLSGSFAQKRTKVLKNVQTAWVFYLDADEVVNDELGESIKSVVGENIIGTYAVTRHNFFLGKQMYNDTVERLFAKTVLRGWKGKVHESAITTARETKLLTGYLKHNTHRNITDMLAKTNEWSEIEAELRLRANHPPVAWWRILRIALSEAWIQFGQKQVWRYGREGFFEGYFQIVDKVIVYTKLWALQNVKEKSLQGTSH